jgi:hypothetical protein
MSESRISRLLRRPLSYPLLKICFVLVFFVLVTLVARHLLFLPRTFEFEQVSRKQDLAQSFIRPGLNIDNLPLVRIDYGKYKPASEVPGDGDSDDDDGDGDDDSDSLAQRRQKCLTTGAFIGPENDGALNCSEYCNVTSDEVEYAFLTNRDTRRILNGRTRMRVGAYCLPTRLATCNRNTSLVVYSIVGWTCIPTTDAFAGEGGHTIVVCNGQLRDNALRVVYDQYIPPNLVFGNVYTDRLSDGKYRFQCAEKERDELGNLYLQSPLNRLHQLRNWCSADIPYAFNDTIDWNRGVCLCDTAHGQIADKLTGRCTACRRRFDDTSKQISYVQRPCYSFNDNVLSFQRRLKELRDRLNVHPYDATITMFPCGWNDQGTSSEYSLPRCLDYFVALYRPVLPSHNTLNNIDSYSIDKYQN